MSNSTSIPVSVQSPQTTQVQLPAGNSALPTPTLVLQGDLSTFLVIVAVTILAKVLMGQSHQSEK